jgi:hypothetical protein
MNLRVLRLFYCLLCVSLTTISVGHTQNSVRDAELQIERLLRDAISYYENLEIDPMEDSLERILNIERRFGPATPRMAKDISQAYIYKGLLVSLQDSRNTQGIKRYFIKAIEINDQAQMSSSIRTPTLSRIFEDARRQARPRNNGYAAGGGYNNSDGRANNQGGRSNNQGGSVMGGAGVGAATGGAGSRVPNGGGGYGNNSRDPYGNNNTQNPYNNNRATNQKSYGNDQRTYPNKDEGYRNNNSNQNTYRTPKSNDRYANTTKTRGGSDNDISHTPPLQVMGGRTFDVRINIAPYLVRQVYWATLFYQTRATNGTQKVEMSRENDRTFAAQIPANFVTGDRIQYYIVLYDQSKSILTSYRNSRSPVSLQIVGGRYANLTGGLSKGNAGNKDYKVSVGILPGTGIGQVTETAALQIQKSQKVTEGFAATPFHTQLEFDYWTSKSFGIGLFTRIQVIEFAFAGGLHAKWRFKHGDQISSALRFGAGYGRVRHLVPVNTSTKSLLDTTLAGPIFYKLGIELSYHLSSRIAFKPTVDFLHLIALDVADTTQSPSRQFDINLGLEVKF